MTNDMTLAPSIRRLAWLLGLLAAVPVITVLLTEANKRTLVWYIRIVDLVDLVVLAPFFLIVLFSLHTVAFPSGPRCVEYWLSLGFIGVFLYGHAMHVTANAINTYSTEIRDYRNILPPDVYALIYFFDEELGHGLLYGGLFLVLGIWILSGEQAGVHWSMKVSGALAGISYAVAVIEGSQPWLGFVAAAWLLICTLRAASRVREAWSRYWQRYPFALFGVWVACFLIVGELAYALLLGGFIQPSQLGL